jgi:hypothetical protein
LLGIRKTTVKSTKYGNFQLGPIKSIFDGSETAKKNLASKKVSAMIFCIKFTKTNNFNRTA